MRTILLSTTAAVALIFGAVVMSVDAGAGSSGSGASGTSAGSSGTSGGTSAGTSGGTGGSTAGSGTSGGTSGGRSGTAGTSSGTSGGSAGGTSSGTAGGTSGERGGTAGTSGGTAGERGAAGSRGERDTAGARGEHGGAVTTQQRTEIRQAFTSVHVRPVENVHFNVAVGTVIPADVELHACPARIVEIHPAWRGCHFVVVKNEIVIVDSSRKIVEIIRE